MTLVDVLMVRSPRPPAARRAGTRRSGSYQEMVADLRRQREALRARGGGEPSPAADPTGTTGGG
jgi:hypothetical protein